MTKRGRDQEETWIEQAHRDSPWMREIRGSQAVEGVLPIAAGVLLFAVLAGGRWLF